MHKLSMIWTSALAASLMFSVQALRPAGAYAATAQASDQASIDSQLQEDVRKALDKSQFKDVQATVQGSEAYLKGTVALFVDKEDAEKRAHRVKRIVAVRNDIQVAGPEISDIQLQDKLVKSISYDRVGYGTTAFNAIGVSVQDGVVTLGGHAYGPVDKDSALSLASRTPGVKDVIDEIQVDPVSPMDDGIRLRVARAVYGYGPLQRYAIDPAKPIRISVQNGNVTLYGQVNSKADKDTAGIRANGVPGVFKVVNNLQVASQEQSKK